MSSRFKAPSLSLAGVLGMGVGQAENFIRLRVENFSLQRQKGKKKVGGRDKPVFVYTGGGERKAVYGD